MRSAVFLINSLGTGGAERAVAEIAVELRKLGREVRLLCLELPPANEALSVPVEVFYLSRMPSFANGIVKLLALPFLAMRLSGYIARHHVDVVMSHLFRANAVNILATVLLRSRHRTVAVNHTRLSRLQEEGFQGRISWSLCRWLYPKADIVANVSAGAAAESARLLALPADRCIVLHDPINTRAAARAARAALPAEAVVGIGRLVDLKRYQDLIDAFARVAPDFPGLELRLVGDGPCRKALERRTSESGVGERTRFLGTLTDPFSALAGCKAFVSTSGTEGFGMAIVEALASGVPVIASDCAYGPREILSPSSDSAHLLEPGSGMELAPYGILYPVGSVRALEDALRALLGDSVLSADLSRKGPLRAADFAIEKSAAAYERLLFLS